MISCGNYCAKIEGPKKRSDSVYKLDFKKPIGVAAADISHHFTFKGGKTTEERHKAEMFCPFLYTKNMEKQDEESLKDTFRRVLELPRDRQKTVEDKLVVEIGVIFGGDAALEANKHFNCPHQKYNHHRYVMSSYDRLSVLHCRIGFTNN